MSTTTAKPISVDPLETAPVLVGRPDDRALTESLLQPVLEPVRKGWAALLLVLLGVPSSVRAQSAAYSCDDFGWWENAQTAFETPEFGLGYLDIDGREVLLVSTEMLVAHLETDLKRYVQDRLTMGTGNG